MAKTRAATRETTCHFIRSLRVLPIPGFQAPRQTIIRPRGLERDSSGLTLDPALGLGEIQENATVRGLAPYASLYPRAVLDFVTNGVFAIPRNFGESLDQHPLAGVAHGALPCAITAMRSDLIDMVKLSAASAMKGTRVGVRGRR
jgi:hypothetical protein